MASYIGIGLVYNNDTQNRIESELRSIVNYLIGHDGTIKKAKYSKDEEGNEWIERIFTNNLAAQNIYSLLSNFYFGQLDIVCDIFDRVKLNICITIKKVDKSYFGLLLYIAEEELIGVSSTENINSITEQIICFLNDLYDISDFDYAFCDNEAEVQYSPLEFELLNKKVYSVVGLPVTSGKKEIEIIKSNWNIDGLTTRIV